MTSTHAHKDLPFDFHNWLENTLKHAEIPTGVNVQGDYM